MQAYSLPEVASILANWARLADIDVDRSPIADVLVRHSKARQLHAMAASVRQALFAESAQAAPAKAPKAPRKAAAAKVAKYGGEQFEKDLGAAQRAIVARYGLGWKCGAPMGEAVPAVIPAALRRYKTARGALIQMPENQRVPAAKYWPGGILPDGLMIVADYARDTDDRNARRQEHSKEWMIEHGYVWFRGAWAQPMEITGMLAREDQAATDEALRLAEFATQAESEEEYEAELADAAD